MRIIESNNLENLAPAQSGRSGETSQVTSSGRNSAPAGKNGAADRVELSGFAGRVSQILETDAGSRGQRVAQLTAVVRSGSYQVDAAAISKAIVSRAISSGGW